MRSSFRLMLFRNLHVFISDAKHIWTSIAKAQRGSVSDDLVYKIS